MTRTYKIYDIYHLCVNYNIYAEEIMGFLTERWGEDLEWDVDVSHIDNLLLTRWIPEHMEVELDDSDV